MNVRFAKSFDKQYKKLDTRIKTKVNAKIELFIANPNSPELHTHALSGKYQGYYSINITGDFRALYEYQGDALVIFGFVGTHSQLYK